MSHERLAASPALAAGRRSMPAKEGRWFVPWGDRRTFNDQPLREVGMTPAAEAQVRWAATRLEAVARHCVPRGI